MRVWMFQVTLVSFTTYVLIDENNILDAQTAFVALSLFNILRFPLAMLPMVIMMMVQSAVSIRRIDSFMNAEDLDLDSVSHDPNAGKRRGMDTQRHVRAATCLSDLNGFFTDVDTPLKVEDGSFAWGPGEPAILKDINLRVDRGKLVAVVGAVGSGKTSLLSALLGEMEKQCGRVNTAVSQLQRR